MKLVDPAQHEFAANFVFDEYGLDPFFGADAQVKAGDGSQRERFELEGEEWVATLYYQDSGILPPETGTTPAGTSWNLEEMREFRIQVRARDDPVGKRRCNMHIAPRWQGIQAEKDDGSVTDLSVPKDLEEGVNVKVSGANIPFDAYHDLMRAAAEAVGINGWYFKNPHPYSNIVDAARYVRLHCDRSGPVHGRDGPIATMAHLLEHDRTGYRKVVQNDDDDHASNLPGYYHTVTLGPRRVQEAFPDHTFPREIKHYYAREALAYSKDHPLRHPKIEVSYQRSKWDGKLGVDEIGELQEQLDQTVHSVLAAAGVQVHAGADDPFFPDAYFEPLNVEQGDDWLYSLDLTKIEHDQESIVLKYLADGLSPVEWESLQTLVSDGGEVAPVDIATEHDRHPDSVRRALRRMEGLLDRQYRRVALSSPFIGELIHKKVKIAREASREAADATAKLAHAAENELDEHTSAFIAWAAAVGADVDSRDDARMILRFGEMKRSDKIRRYIQEGYRLWTDAGKDPSRYREAEIDLAGAGKTVAWRWL